MLYPTWQPLPRPRHFPEDPKLNRLLASNYDPCVGHFSIPMKRRNARDLRKGIFGPKGLKDVPAGKGARRFSLPGGWTLLLSYYEKVGRLPGDVLAAFIPPGRRNERRSSIAEQARGQVQEAGP